MCKWIGIALAGCAMLAQAASAAASCVTLTFEGVETSTSVVGDYAISPLLSITGQNMQVVEEGLANGSILAYNANNGAQTNVPGRENWLPGDNTKAFGNDAVNDQSATCEDLRIDFNPTIQVSSFSIDVFDYGDWFPLGGSNPRTATLKAYDKDGLLLDEHLLSINGPSANYDAQNGGQTLDVASAGNAIAYVELKFQDVDPGVTFDNLQICYTNLVTIDIKPGSYPNAINIDGHGVITVAILGSAEFDVSTIDIGTISFAGLTVKLRGNDKPLCEIEDVSGDFSGGLEGAPDGYPDLVCHFLDDPNLWDPQDGEAGIMGYLLDNTPIFGVDTIKIVP